MLKNYAQLIGLLVVLIISVVDYIIVIDISLSILYLLPISLTIWYSTRWFSFLLVLISTVGWFIAEFSAANTKNLVYAAPVPQAVILTAIVIGFSIMALMLVAAMKLAKDNPTLETSVIEESNTP